MRPDLLFAVYKPPGITSAYVTNILRRIILTQEGPSGQRLKVGHGGVLDKLAEGVLVIGVGKGCNELHNYLHGDKVYIAAGVLGTSTITHDREGEITQTLSYEHVTLSNMKKVLCSFEGHHYQTPPVYSGLKFNGMRASDLARKGLAVDMSIKARLVTIYRIDLIHFVPPTFLISVHCSSGTYIRSLIYDVGSNLNTAAFMSSLCRIKQGVFTSQTALKQEDWNYSMLISDRINLLKRKCK